LGENDESNVGGLERAKQSEKAYFEEYAKRVAAR